jgi:hypothetical protein
MGPYDNMEMSLKRRSREDLQKSICRFKRGCNRFVIKLYQDSLEESNSGFESYRFLQLQVVFSFRGDT